MKLKIIVIIYFSILSFLILDSCQLEIASPNIPDSKISNYLTGTQEIPNEYKSLINGLYLISDGKETFGDTAVVKWSGKYLSIFVKKQQTYIILQGGLKNQELDFAGYWRYAMSSDAGYVQLSIDSSSSQQLIKFKNQKELKFIGFFNSNGVKNQNFELSFLDTLKSKEYYIIAHRGGGRNVDRLPASENSVEIIQLAESFGANGVELDVQLTSDSIPVLFHDEYLNKRLINQDYFIGKVSEYSYKVLKNFVTLKNGEKIPTLEEALNTIITKTNLKIVWLDIKTAEVIPKIIPIIQEANEMIISNNRLCKILIGVPSDVVFNEALKYKDFPNISFLCELDNSKVDELNAGFWGPRWSLGLQDDNVNLMHSENRKVITWTLDEQVFIKKFISQGKFDGILTNYPFLVAYEFYTNN